MNEERLIEGEEARTQLWLFVFALVLACIAAGIIIYLGSEFPSLDTERSLTSNLSFFLLINLNIIVIMVLGFLVAKNLVKLFLDRRRNILGAKLRSRLVAAFVGLSLVPTVLLFLVARGILERVLQEWFSPQITASVDGAFDVAKYHYDTAEAQLYREARHVALTLAKLYPVLPKEGFLDTAPLTRGGPLASYLEEKRDEYGLFELALVESAGEVAGSAKSVEAGHQAVDVPGLNARAIVRAKDGEIVVLPERSLEGEFLRAYAPVRVSLLPGMMHANALGTSWRSESIDRIYPKADVKYVLVATVWLLPELSRTLASVVNAYDDYKEIKSYHRPLASSYFLALLVVTMLIVFSAIWVGFYLAKQLSVPIGLLAEGTQQIAHGNLAYRIPELGDDELSVLVRSFNIMTKDLQDTTGELVARRRYIETIVASVGIGVMSVDTDGFVTTCNLTAQHMLGLAELPSRHRFQEVLPEVISEGIVEMLDEVYAGSEKLVSTNLEVNIADDLKHVHLTGTKLFDESGQILGAVLLLDDISELVSAQRVAAWREVARRIAHEIKNPLTPIQLSAERLQRRFAKGAGDSGLNEKDRTIIAEATELIVRQVENMRVLVNEFSRFARMPRAHLRPFDINDVIENSVRIYRGSHQDVRFITVLDRDVPMISIDPEQISRALVNLIENAIDSVRSAGEVRRNSAGTSEVRGTVALSTAFNSDLGLVSISVSDDGTGIAEREKHKLFEPYFSTKRGGTGLGLAIVNTIVGDHNGFIRVRDNPPRGATFVIELPVPDELRKLQVG